MSRWTICSRLPVMIDYFDEMRGEGVTVVSPDAGGVERARAFAKRSGCAAGDYR